MFTCCKNSKSSVIMAKPTHHRLWLFKDLFLHEARETSLKMKLWRYGLSLIRFRRKISLVMMTAKETFMIS